MFLDRICPRICICKKPFEGFFCIWYKCHILRSLGKNVQTFGLFFHVNCLQPNWSVFELEDLGLAWNPTPLWVQEKKYSTSHVPEDYLLHLNSYPCFLTLFFFRFIETDLQEQKPDINLDLQERMRKKRHGYVFLERFNLLFS